VSGSRHSSGPGEALQHAARLPAQDALHGLRCLRGQHHAVVVGVPSARRCRLRREVCRRVQHAGEGRRRGPQGPPPPPPPPRWALRRPTASTAARPAPGASSAGGLRAGRVARVSRRGAASWPVPLRCEPMHGTGAARRGCQGSPAQGSHACTDPCTARFSCCKTGACCMNNNVSTGSGYWAQWAKTRSSCICSSKAGIVSTPRGATL